MLPARWSQQLSQKGRGVSLVAAPDQQSDAAYQDVQCQAVMPLFGPADHCCCLCGQILQLADDNFVRGDLVAASSQM